MSEAFHEKGSGEGCGSVPLTLTHCNNSAEKRFRRWLFLQLGELNWKLFTSHVPDVHGQVTKTWQDPCSKWPLTVWSKESEPIPLTFPDLPELFWSVAGYFTNESIPLTPLVKIIEVVNELRAHGPLDVDQLEAFLLKVLQIQMTFMFP
jgi:hypothetical protein